ncbi:hypothetical protein Tco_0642248 [Tanacetum coccineum]
MEVDTPYSAIDENNVKGGFQPERLAQARIRHIFFDGYDVLVFRIVIFKISSFKLQNACLFANIHQMLFDVINIQCQLPPKELNPRNFTLLCTIGNFTFYGMADIGASVNVMPRNIFEYLRLANLRNINMHFEMADMTKKAPLDRHFLASIHAKIDVFDKEISLGTDNDRVSYDMEKKDHNFTIPTEKFFMIKSDLNNRPQSPACSDNQSRKLRDRSPDDGLQIKAVRKGKALLKLWLIDCFQDESGIIIDPLSRSFYDYKCVFDLEIDQLADEYELRIGKKGHMLDKIWEYCKDVHRNNTYWWHDHGFEEEERDEMGIKIEKYDPPKVQVETFKVKKYSFKSGQKFICVTKEVDDALPLGKKNGSRLWFHWISFDYRVTLVFGSIVGGLDQVNPVIRLPLELGISRVLGKVDPLKPSVGTNQTFQLFWCDTLHTEAFDQEFEAFSCECFSEDIRQLIIGLYKVELNNPVFNLFFDKVVANNDVFCPGVLQDKAMALCESAYKGILLKSNL